MAPITGSDPLYPPGKTRAAAIVLLMLAVAAAGLAASELLPFLSAATRNDAVLAIWARMLAGFPLSVMFAAFAVMLVLSLRIGRESRLIGRCFIVAILCLLLVPVTPWLVSAIIQARLEAGGYVRCPVVLERYTRTRWAKNASLCPASR